MGSITALLIISLFSYNNIFLMLHKKENLYFAQPNIIAVVLFSLWIFFAVLSMISDYDEILRKAISIKDFVHNKNGFFTKCCIKIIVFIVILCIAIFVNLKQYISYNSEGYFKNGCQIFSNAEVKSVDVKAERIIASFSGNGVVHKYVLTFLIYTDKSEVEVMSDQFYGYEKIYDFLCMNGDIVHVDFEKFDELIDYENRTGNRNATEYIDKIVREFS
ncbi:MAG: hypothetical protein ACI4GY_10620 [Acutalibacteraceae bacterium]